MTLCDDVKGRIFVISAINRNTSFIMTSLSFMTGSTCYCIENSPKDQAHANDKKKVMENQALN